MRSKEYRINITPIACNRIVRSSNRSYDSLARDKVSFGLYLAQQHNEEPFYSNPIHIDVIFYMPIPKPVKERAERVSDVYHIGVPYIDNLWRFFVDAIKDIIIADERVICSFSAKKVYDKEPRTEVIITEVV